MGGPAKETVGPFTFGNAVQLDQTKSQCVEDNRFQMAGGDPCMMNPGLCSRGLSLSLFYKGQNGLAPGDLEQEASAFTRQYILSTGGARGFPGVGLFIVGPYLGAELSTGNLTWSLLVKGNLPLNNTWNNIAIRWKMPLSTQAEYTAWAAAGGPADQLGGLELFLNLKKIGHMISPEESCDPSCTDPTGCHVCPPPYTPQASLNPPTVMLGCHRQSNTSTHSNFLSGVYDEVAIWRHQVLDNETGLFYGGYSSSMEGMSASQLVNMMGSVDLRDPAQASAALQVLNAAGSPTTTPAPAFRNIVDTTIPPAPILSTRPGVSGGSPGTTSTPTTTQSTTSPVPKTDALTSWLSLMLRMTDPQYLPANSTMEALMNRLAVFPLVGSLLNPAGQYPDGWQQILASRNLSSGVAQQLRQQMEAYLMTLVGTLLPPNRAASAGLALEVQGSNSLLQIYRASADNLTRLSTGEEGLRFPGPTSERPTSNYQPDFFFSVYKNQLVDMWAEIGDSVQVPATMFSGICTNYDTNAVFAMYDNFPDAGLKNPVGLPVNRVELASRVVSVRATANLWQPGRRQFSQLCQPDDKLMASSRIYIQLLTKSSGKGLRRLQFHEDETRSRVASRHCAIWNPDLGLTGAWDTDNIETVQANDISASCITDRLGTYAILAVLVDDPVPYKADAWLPYIEVPGYIISIICLILFIVFVQLSPRLWEQFNILTINVCLAMAGGHLCMLLGQLQVVQADRHACTAVGCSIQICYTTAAFFLAGLSHACFKAMTAGIVGGLSQVYISFGWGVPFIVFGYDILQNLQEMGTDPICFLGWENNVKWNFFLPVLVGAGVGVMLMLVVTCNMTAEIIRLPSKAEEMNSKAVSVLLMVCLFAVTWILGVFALVKFPGSGIPNFYPIFQVFNCLSGVYLFLLLGLSSATFRSAIQEILQPKKASPLEKKSEDFNQ